MFITNRLAADDKGLSTHRDSSVPRLPAGFQPGSLDSSSQAARGNGDGGRRVQRNGFFTGLICALPLSGLLWGIIILSVRAIID